MFRRQSKISIITIQSRIITTVKIKIVMKVEMRVVMVVVVILTTINNRLPSMSIIILSLMK